MKNRSTQRHSSQAAFTLMEMMVVMLVLTLLLGAIVAIVRGTVQLTDDVSVAQAREARLHGLAQLAERTFRSLSGDSMVRLRTTAAGNRYLTQLLITGAPTLLANQGAMDEVLVLETEEAPDGYLRLMMRCMTTEQAVAWEGGETRAGTKLRLLENIASLEWRFLNAASGQWEPLWNEGLPLPQRERHRSLPVPGTEGVAETDEKKSSQEIDAAELSNGRRPGLVELVVAQGADPPQRWTFWVPKVAVPGPLKAPLNP